ARAYPTSPFSIYSLWNEPPRDRARVLSRPDAAHSRDPRCASGNGRRCGILDAGRRAGGSSCEPPAGGRPKCAIPHRIAFRLGLENRPLLQRGSRLALCNARRRSSCRDGSLSFLSPPSALCAVLLEGHGGPHSRPSGQVPCSAPSPAASTPVRRLKPNALDAGE